MSWYQNPSDAYTRLISKDVENYKDLNLYPFFCYDNSPQPGLH